MFVFYYAVLSAITPPVALAVFAAAAIAKENPVKLAGNAIRICFVGFLLPIIWIYHPEIFLADLPIQQIPQGIAFVGAMLIAILAMTAAHVGYFKGPLNIPERVFLLVAGIAIIIPGALLTLSGIAVAAIYACFRWRKDHSTVAG
jgi:TRAP-type uncharacterized transport system fused permease subunit